MKLFEACRIFEENVDVENASKILVDAIEHYGTVKQTAMMIEEMSELTKAICKYNRLDSISGNGACGTAARAAIREEMADVQIMLWQMGYIFGDPTNDIEYKIDRLKNRMESERECLCQH